MRWVAVYTYLRDGSRVVNKYAIRSDCGRYRVARVYVCGDVWYEAWYSGEMIGEPTHDPEEARKICENHAIKAGE